MARPKSAPHERRTASTRCDLTLAEKELLVARVAASGVGSEAEFVRQAIFAASIRPPAPQRTAYDPSLVTELNRIGVNLNQIAKAMNAGRGLPSSLETAQAELRAVLTRVLTDGA